VLALFALTAFQMIAGQGTQTIDSKYGIQLLQGDTVSYAEIVDNRQMVKLTLNKDFSVDASNGQRAHDYGKDVQFYYTPRRMRRSASWCRRPTRPRAGP
jgi:cell division protease FtsH